MDRSFSFFLLLFLFSPSSRNAETLILKKQTNKNSRRNRTPGGYQGGSLGGVPQTQTSKDPASDVDTCLTTVPSL
jgi:hypothetical protein